MSNAVPATQLTFDSIDEQKTGAASDKGAQPPKGVKLAPMLEQYVNVKQQHSDHILMFQVGDFYEIFFDDAVVAAEVLGIRLTSRDKNSPNPIAMCGVPIHAIDNYIPKLLEAGYSCALMSQVEDAKASKGMVKREMTRIITPGVRYDGDGLLETQNNYLASVVISPRGTGAVCYVDVSTGHMHVSEVSDESELLTLLEFVQASEIVIPSTYGKIKVETKSGWLVQVKKYAKENSVHTAARPFDPVNQSKLEQALTTALVGVGDVANVVSDLGEEGRCAVDAVLNYIADVSPVAVPKLVALVLEKPQDAVVIDSTTRRNLELFESRIEGNRKHSLIAHIDFCKTSMGSRLLRERLRSPSTCIEEVVSRHDALEALLNAEVVSDIRSVLTEVRDLERLLSRIVTLRATPRDLRLLCDSIERLPELKTALAGEEVIGRSTILKNISQRFDVLGDVYQKLSLALVEEPPSKLNEGGIFKDGYSEEVDKLRNIATNGKALLAQLEAKERARTDISSLKIKYNSVFGYFLEVSKTQLAKVPEDYERKQTLANAERFITQELKELEVSILSARARQVDLEKELFVEMRSWLCDLASRIGATAQDIALLDVFAGFAELAKKKSYTRPVIKDRSQSIIKGGRHPVVEGVIGQHNFIPNDLELNSGDRRFAVLTGPNMGGKSTYLRQAGLIHLLAQAGSFVPAAAAELGIVDRIFTRIGTGDDISRGDSTFMVEMREVTSIVKNATAKSLVLIDEIGRGTATTDGLAIATAIAEWLHSSVKCRTIFATHFHELTDLAKAFSGAFCISVGVIEKPEEKEIVFTHRIEETSANRSFGLEVARLAGLPEEILERATQVLLELERDRKTNESVRTIQEVIPERSTKEVIPKQVQKTLDAIKAYDLNNMTPLQALSEISRLKELVEDKT